MSDKSKFEQLLDLLVNEEKEKAEGLFHDIVVEKSKEISRRRPTSCAVLGFKCWDFLEVHNGIYIY